LSSNLTMLQERWRIVGTKILRTLSNIVRSGPGLTPYERQVSSSSSVLLQTPMHQDSENSSFDFLRISVLEKSPWAPYASPNMHTTTEHGRLRSSLKNSKNELELYKYHGMTIDNAKWKMLYSCGIQNHLIAEVVSILNVGRDWRHPKFHKEDQRMIESDSESIFHADSVRRKRKRKMNKHKHAKRRKLNRHRR